MRITMPNTVKIGILGAGTWGIALARMLFNAGRAVTVWSAIEKEIDALAETGRHPNLPGTVLPNGIVYTKDIREACLGADIVMFAVPSFIVMSKTYQLLTSTSSFTLANF